VAVIGPYLAFPHVVRGRQMYGIGGAEEDVRGSLKHQHAGSAEQGFSDRNELPEAVMNMLREAGG
jgi:hypothetical protein